MSRNAIDDDLMVELGPEEVKALESSFGSLSKTRPEAGKANVPGKDVQGAKAGDSAKTDDGEGGAKGNAGAVPSAAEFDTLRRDLAGKERALAEERTKRAAAESKASQHEVDLAVSAANTLSSNYRELQAAKSQAEQALAAAKQRQKQAQETGDYDKLGDITEEIAAARQKIDLFKDGMEEVKVTHAQALARVEALRGGGDTTSGKGAATAAKSDGTDRAPSQEDRFSAWRETLQPLERAWVDAHPDVFKDTRLFKKMTGLAHLAEADGLVPGSAEFIAYVDRGMGYAKGDEMANARGGRDTGDGGDGGADVIVDTRKAAAKTGDDAASGASGDRRVSAPVSRSGGGVEPNGNGSYRVRLTAAEVEIAESMGITKAQYAAQKARLKMAERDPSYGGPRFSS